MRFRYEGFDKNTSVVKRGYIDSDCIENASSRLRDEFGIIPQQLEPDSDQPMRNVLPGDAPFEEMAAKARAALPETIFQRVAEKQPDGWRDRLKAELIGISEVAQYVRSLEGAAGNPLAAAAIEGALKESISKAITNAIEARVRG